MGAQEAVSKGKNDVRKKLSEEEKAKTAENKAKFNAGFTEYYGETPQGMSALDELDAKIGYAQKMFDD